MISFFNLHGVIVNHLHSLFTRRSTQGAVRAFGNAFDSMGASLEVAKYTERLVPSTRFVAVDGVSPQVAPGTAFVAPSASIIGDVTIGNGSR